MLRYKLHARDLETELVPRSAPELGPVRDLRAQIRHDAFAGEARVLALDGLALVRGRHQADRDLLVHGHESAPEVALHIGLRGAPTARAEGVEGFLSHTPNVIELVYTPAPHTTFELTAGADNEAFEVNFSVPRFGQWAAQYPELFGDFFEAVQRGEPRRLRAPLPWAPPRLAHLLDEILSSERFGALRGLYIETKVQELLLELAVCSELSPSQSAPDHERALAARDLLLEDLRRPPSAEALARRLGTNAHRLRRDFRALFQTSLYAFALDARLQHAHWLVVSTQRPLKAIADDVGYAHLAHFSAAFRKKFGVAPSQLRSVHAARSRSV